MNHTKSPWHKETGAGAYTVILDENNARVAHIFSRTIPNEQHGNANLVIAAPRMREACDSVLDDLVELEAAIEEWLEPGNEATGEILGFVSRITRKISLAIAMADTGKDCPEM